MANLTITVANLQAVSGYAPLRGTSGATITAGMPCYIDTDGTMKISEAGSTAIKAVARGISLHAAVSGQPLELICFGNLAFGAILTKGVFYVVSATAGLICPLADITTTGHYIMKLGQASSTSNLILDINRALDGITVP